MLVPAPDAGSRSALERRDRTGRHGCGGVGAVALDEEQLSHAVHAVSKLSVGHGRGRIDDDRNGIESLLKARKVSVKT
ncbi:hypothetical protein [Mesorhizobium sp. M0965]|uniref:hypothetical protein n=1 Tax=unclassified Mesorhizobium TaxID=325217 RepID=UPI00333718EB